MIIIFMNLIWFINVIFKILIKHINILGENHGKF